MECTINGIGERAGNAALEEIAVALAVRKESYQAETNLQLDHLFPTSRMLTEITRVPRCRLIKPSWAPMRSRTKRGSIRTAFSRIR